jgi:hypothetical protein
MVEQGKSRRGVINHETSVLCNPGNRNARDRVKRPFCGKPVVFDPMSASFFAAGWRPSGCGS